MPQYFLSKLVIEGFRGINNEGDPLVLQFHPDRVNSVYADNGYGKSSIFEALQYALTGHVDKLHRLQQSEHAEEYYNNLFHTGDSRIELLLSPDDGTADVNIVVERSNDGTRTVSSPSGHPAPDDFLATLATDITLLDYATFQAFIDDSPLKRGRSFASLLGLSFLSDLRQSLSTLANKNTLEPDIGIDRLQASVAALTTAAKQANATIRTAFEQLLGTPPPNPIKNEEIDGRVIEALKQVELLAPSIGNNSLLEVDFAGLEKTISAAERSDLRAQLAEANKKHTELLSLAPTDKEAESREHMELANSVDARDLLIKETRGQLFQQLLEAASEVIASPDWDTPDHCPLCTSLLDGPIAAILEQQKAAFAKVAKAQTEILNAWNSASCISRLRRCMASAALDLGDPQSPILQMNAKDLGSAGKEEFESALKAIDEADKARERKLEEITKHKEAIEKALPASLVALSNQLGYAKTIRDALRDRTDLKEKWSNTKPALGRRREWQSFIETAAEWASRLEQGISQIRTDQLKEQCSALFAQIMCQPPIKPDIVRDPANERLHLQLESFHDLSELSAAALLSESYRNALAISIFLSAAIAAKSPSGFVVLDDITSSFDAGHQLWLMEAIRTQVARNGNPAGPQIIILSHDTLLEKYFDRMASEATWHHQKLQGMPVLGLLFGQAQVADRIRAQAERLLSTGMVLEGQGLVRQYLEYVLLQVIRQVSIPVPIDMSIKDNKKMIGNCLKAIQAAIKLHEQAGNLILEQSQLDDIDGVHAPAIISNWVSHYETGGGGGVSGQALIGVLQSADALSECFKYDCDCGTTRIRKWYRSLQSKQCGC